MAGSREEPRLKNQLVKVTEEGEFERICPLSDCMLYLKLLVQGDIK